MEVNGFGDERKGMCKHSMAGRLDASGMSRGGRWRWLFLPDGVMTSQSGVFGIKERL